MPLRICLVSSLVSPLEVEVKSEENAAAPHAVCRKQWRPAGSVAAFWHDTDRFSSRVFGVESEACAAKHDRIPTVTERVGRHVAVVARCAERTLGVPTLIFSKRASTTFCWIEVVVGFQKATMESGSLGTGRQRSR